ncbi:hypothetical protein WJ438_15455 [Streptomyces sp. GD-15H]|uniref:hypothetical protein n=1 Tax=Streptomyces sp. GD-15H TaxID=3129112 RepID=UPI003251A4FD
MFTSRKRWFVMSVDQHSDPFEERLSSALHDTGNAFEADRSALTDGGRARGRRMRVRRRAAVLGGAAGIALVGVGGALLLPGGTGAGAGRTGGRRQPREPRSPPTPGALRRPFPVRNSSAR